MKRENSQRPAGHVRIPVPPRDRRRARALTIGTWEFVIALALAGAAAAGCGKKGPPLAPIVHVPAAVDKLAARRIGNDIYLSVTIPTQNIDSSTPADVSRIEIFAVTTSTPPPRPRIFEIASRVGTIDVQPAPRPGQAEPPAPSSGSTALPVQGATVTIRDTLAPADLVPKELPAVPRQGPAGLVSAPPAPSPFPRRYYLAIAQSDRGRQGPPGTLLDVPLLALPDPPGPPTFSYTQDAVTVSWEPSGGIVGFLFENPAQPEPAPVEDETATATPAAPAAVALPGGPTLYNVYRELAPPDGASPASAAPSEAVPPTPINPAPLAALTYTDSTELQFERQRCYTVRAVRGTPPNAVISVPSERVCMTPEDRFPPEAPTALSAISAEGVISLLWEPNGEADLGGYVVLRGRAGDATLQPLTDTPVKDNRYADRDVTPGVRYVYAVRAVDTHTPAPNVSAESNRVEETAQ